MPYYPRPAQTGQVANVCVTEATGTAEREAAASMLTASAPPGSTVGADVGYAVARFVDDVGGLQKPRHRGGALADRAPEVRLPGPPGG